MMTDDGQRPRVKFRFESMERQAGNPRGQERHACDEGWIGAGRLGGRREMFKAPVSLLVIVQVLL